MNRLADAFLTSWPTDPWLAVGLLAAIGVYLRGWLLVRRQDRARWPLSQPCCFIAGLATIYLALASPLEPFAALLLSVHMAQHLLLMMAAPALIWLGEPIVPLLRGLPRGLRSDWLAPLLGLPWLRRLFGILVHPAVALAIFVAATWAWHWPGLYELALANANWHYLQHATFLAAGLLFWFPVIRPYPYRPAWSLWLVLPYLLAADVQNTILSAIFTFADRVLYPHYAAMPVLGRWTALDDQAAAGVLMWVPGSAAFLAPLGVLALRLLFGRSSEVRVKPLDRRAVALRPVRLTVLGSPGSAVRENGRIRRFDLLRAPLVGPLLRHIAGRTLLQSLMLVVAIVIVIDGFSGPQVGAMNLAGVLPWIHWRGLVVLGLLVAGNLSCMACPFTLPRRWTRGVWSPPLRWPSALKNKWPAVFLLGLFFFAYEAFALWDWPAATAAIVVAYFIAAFTIDALFQGANFCKSVCPIGQFNLIQSLISPFSIAARDPAVCTACTTKDCIRGNAKQPGCELALFVPQKVGNLDCTLCLACVDACPSANVGLLAAPPLAAPPLAALSDDRPQSGIGRPSQRLDLAMLVMLLVAASLANAAGMIAPVVAIGDAAGKLLGSSGRLLFTSGFYFAALLVVPLSLGMGTAWLARAASGNAQSTSTIAARFVYAFVPLAFAMWTAHYSFHFLTTYDAIVPVSERFLTDHGWPQSTPVWVCGCCRAAPDWILAAELTGMVIGFGASLLVAERLAVAEQGATPRGLAMFLPFAGLLFAFFAAGVWILCQPMEMRGTMPML